MVPVRGPWWAAAPMGPRPATVRAPRDSPGAEVAQQGDGPRRARRDRERGRVPESARRLRWTPAAPAAHRHAGRRGAAQRRGLPPAPPAWLPPHHPPARPALHAPAPFAVARAGWRYSSPACPGHAPASRPVRRPRWRHSSPIGPPAANPPLAGGHRLPPARPKIVCSGRSRHAGLRGLRRRGATAPPGRWRPRHASRMQSSPRHWPPRLPLPTHRHPGHPLRSAKQAAQADRGSAPDLPARRPSWGHRWSPRIPRRRWDSRRRYTAARRRSGVSR